jgi:NAD(P)-dependent dehydrogenase (short-subunit alcohol dehydrogenase family)
MSARSILPQRPGRYHLYADLTSLLDAIADLFATVQAVPRVGVTDDVAKAALFLASGASSFVTGQDLVVDGGLVPFGPSDWKEAVEFRTEIARRVKAQIDPVA